MREARATHIGSNAYLTLTRIWQRIFRSSENTGKAGAPETIRTSDLCLRRATLLGLASPKPCKIKYLISPAFAQDRWIPPPTVPNLCQKSKCWIAAGLTRAQERIPGTARADSNFLLTFARYGSALGYRLCTAYNVYATAS